VDAGQPGLRVAPVGDADGARLGNPEMVGQFALGETAITPRSFYSPTLTPAGAGDGCAHRQYAFQRLPQGSVVDPQDCVLQVYHEPSRSQVQSGDCSGGESLMGSQKSFEDP